MRYGANDWFILRRWQVKLRACVAEYGLMHPKTLKFSKLANERAVAIMRRQLDADN